jgi:hypothetical protein
VLPDSVVTPVDSGELRPSPCADTCRRLPLLVASIGQEKGNVTHADERPAEAANFLALSVDPIVGHYALDVVSKLGLSAADYQKITEGNARRLMPKSKVAA